MKKSSKDSSEGWLKVFLAMLYLGVLTSVIVLGLIVYLVYTKGVVFIVSNINAFMLVSLECLLISFLVMFKDFLFVGLRRRK